MGVLLTLLRNQWTLWCFSTFGLKQWRFHLRSTSLRLKTSLHSNQTPWSVFQVFFSVDVGQVQHFLYWGSDFFPHLLMKGSTRLPRNRRWIWFSTNFPFNQPFLTLEPRDRIVWGENSKFWETICVFCCWKRKGGKTAFVSENVSEDFCVIDLGRTVVH